MVNALLRKGANVNQSISNNSGTDGNSPLIHSCKYGELEIVKVLLNAGADLSHQTKDGKNALDNSKRKKENNNILAHQI